MTACSAKAPASGESRPAAPENRGAAPAQASTAAQTPAAAGTADPGPPPDPRERALSTAVLLLLQHDHLLRKPIDDELSRTAFDTYLDRLDSGKMFLLRKDRDALARYADKIDDELRSGVLGLAHEGTRIYVSRVEVVEKLVAELLAAPFNHDDEESIELDPKKVEVATTEQELRDRWRRRLELEVLERTGQMEARLKAEEDRKHAGAAKPGAAHKVGAKAPGAKAPGAKGAAPKAPDGSGARQPGEAKPRLQGTGPNPDGEPVDGSDAEEDDNPRMPLASIPATPEARDAKARTDMAKSYAARFTRLRHPGPFDPASELINAVAASLDPHTNYLPPADKANFDIRMSGSLEGIGAQLREKDDYVEVVEIVPGGASWRHGGLAPGDLILAVAAEGQDPVDVTDMRLDDVVKMIRGPKGTVVHLRIQKPSGAQETISITRDVVVVEESYARGAVLTHKGLPQVGYIYLPSFYGGRGPSQRTAGRDIARLLREMKTLKLPGVILDIRGDGGGLLGEAVTMTGSLIDRGPVVQVQDGRGNRETYSDDQPGTDYDGQVVVLVDRFSASASEILAGALQDYHRAVIVGTGPTHGKGTVQQLAELDRVTRSSVDLGVLKMTVQQFFRVSGSSTQREGVTPDILLPDPAAHIDSGERTLDHAIPWSQIPAVDHDMWPAKWKATALAERSTARVAKHPALAKMAALTQVLRASREDTRIPLAKAAWEAHRKQRRAAFDAASPDLKSGPASLAVKSLDEPNRPPAPNGKGDDRLSRWRDSVARDPWIDECVSILADMTK